MNKDYSGHRYNMTALQKISLNIIFVLSILTFLLTGLQAKLWQSSQFLLSSVLPTVVVDLTNEERINNNITILRRNVLLDKAAQLKAEDMANRSYFSHSSPDGKTPWYWFDKVGYKYSHAGENLAIHFTDSKKLVDSWIKSPLHHKNIISNKYTDIGIGVADGYFEGKKTVYIVQLFGALAKKQKNNIDTFNTNRVADNNLKKKLKKENAPIIKSNNVAFNKTSKNTKKSVKVIRQPDERELLNKLNNNNYLKTKENTDIANTNDSNSIKKNEGRKEKLNVEKKVEHNNIDTISGRKNFSPIIKNSYASSFISTSSGLISRTIRSDNYDILYNKNKQVSKKFFLLTQPSRLMQAVYQSLVFVTIFLLLLSLFIEIRKKHFIHVSYSLGLLLLMFGLWSAHTWLISDAVIL